ncbi:hypothetical protein BDW62DRAFT_204545 [Aspergillus aurantiobrunneus]
MAHRYNTSRAAAPFPETRSVPPKRELPNTVLGVNDVQSFPAASASQAPTNANATTNPGQTRPPTTANSQMKSHHCTHDVPVPHVQGIIHGISEDLVALQSRLAYMDEVRDGLIRSQYRMEAQYFAVETKHRQTVQQLHNMCRMHQVSTAALSQANSELAMTRQRIATLESRIQGDNNGVGRRQRPSVTSAGLTKRQQPAPSRSQISSTAMVARLRAEGNRLRDEREALVTERDALVAERGTLVAERDRLQAERDAIISERDRLAGQKDELSQELHRALFKKWNSIQDERQEQGHRGFI